MSDSLLTPKEDRQFVKVLASDGSLRMEVPEGTEDAVRRDYETSDGKKGTKYELVFKKLEGHIKSIDIFEGDFGKNLLVKVEKGDEMVTLSIGVSTPFGEDFMKKFPSIDTTKKVSVEPFSFENDEGKLIKGLSIKQDGEKIKNFYFDSDKKKAINKMPEPEGATKKFDKDDWKAYFLKARKFLLGETEKLIKERSLEPDLEEDDVDF